MYDESGDLFGGVTLRPPVARHPLLRACNAPECNRPVPKGRRKYCSEECLEDTAKARRRLHRDEFRQCPGCGVRFKAASNNHTYCTDGCGERARRDERWKGRQCRWCNQPIRRETDSSGKPGRMGGGHFQYCSDECATTASRVREKRRTSASRSHACRNPRCTRIVSVLGRFRYCTEECAAWQNYQPSHYVYVAQNRSAIKIGYSNNPARRLRDIQTDGAPGCWN